MTTIVYPIKPGMSHYPMGNDKYYRDTRFRTNKEGRIALDEKDGQVSVFHAEPLIQYSEDSGQSTMSTFTNFGMGWDVVVTQSRLIYWSPRVTNLFGALSEKQKLGRSTGGSLEYADLSRVVIYPPGGKFQVGIYQNNNRVANMQHKGYYTALQLKDDALRPFIECLARNIQYWWMASGLKVNEIEAEAFAQKVFEKYPGSLNTGYELSIMPPGNTDTYWRICCTQVPVGANGDAIKEPTSLTALESGVMDRVVEAVAKARVSEAPSVTDSSPYTAIRRVDTRQPGDPWLDVTWDAKKDPVAETQDHGMPASIILLGVNLTEGTREVLDTKAASLGYVTDSRVILCCKSWNESYLLAISAAKAVANRGNVFGGHVRYEWLKSIGYVSKRGLYSPARVTLRFVDVCGTEYATSLIPGRHNVFQSIPSVSDIAHDILQKACRYRLSLHDDKNADTLAFYQKHSENPEIPASGDAIIEGTILMPQPYPAPTGQHFRE